MKQMISFVFAGILGGAVTLGGFLCLNGNWQKAHTEAPRFAKQVSNVNVAAGNGPNVPFDFTEAAAKATPAVVHISAKESVVATENQRPQDPFSQFFGDDFFNSPLFGFNMPRQGTGSGVIYSQDGYIITNNHVVGFADEVEVTLSNNEKYTAEIIGTYPEGDLAVLKIDAKNLPTLRIADSDAAKIGEWVLAVGNPLELNSTVTAGIISARGRDINIIKGQSAIESFIQTDAAVNPGNSGGALVDAYGRLLGINTAIATQTGYFEGYSFAIPINLATKIVDDIIENGSYERGFLGINIANVTGDLAKERNLKVVQGVLVDGVVDGGAAQYAGVLPDDVIIEVDTKTVRSTPDLLEVVGGMKAGDTVTLTIDRQGEVLTLPVRLKPAQEK